MIKTGDREKDYLLYLIRCALKQEDAKAPEEEINTERLLRLAVKQQVYTIVLPSLEKLDILPEEEKETWRAQKLSEIRKNLIINSAREALIAELEEKGIKYIFTKGLVIRDYYPNSLMRQMSDNDILYDESKRDELFKIMEEQGFYLAGTQESSDDFFKAPFISMEMHKRLFTTNGEFTAYLDLWKKAERAQDSEYRYIISPDDNYVYSLAHMYKHYTTSGCGIRFLCDMYLLHYSDDKLDFDYINSKLEELGIAEFSKGVMSLVDAVFNDNKATEQNRRLLAEVFAGGVFGIGKSLQESISDNGGKLSYLWRKLFPSVEFMKRNYEILQNKPYLLLPYYVKHFFLRYKNKGDKAKKELKNVLKS